jgi:hypothetical protein
MADVPWDDLRRRWAAHVALPFPANLAGEELDGVDLVLLDADTAGCIQTFIGNLGWRELELRKSLERCLRDLDDILPDLPAQAIGYFTALRDLVALVLAAPSHAE